MFIAAIKQNEEGIKHGSSAPLGKTDGWWVGEKDADRPKRSSVSVFRPVKSHFYFKKTPLF